MWCDICYHLCSLYKTNTCRFKRFDQLLASSETEHEKRQHILVINSFSVSRSLWIKKKSFWPYFVSLRHVTSCPFCFSAFRDFYPPLQKSYLLIWGAHHLALTASVFWQIIQQSLKQDQRFKRTCVYWGNQFHQGELFSTYRTTLYVHIAYPKQRISIENNFILDTNNKS